ncbi:terminase family protein [Streptomyces spectabilis]|uniref:terminase large subunit domain-containing protein n=1 Tax=Streptomyces spectabilis TaxID=68270 RepID=UPI0033DC5A92
MTGPLPLSDKQLDSIRRATARINIWHGSVRSGKTIASLVRFLLALRRAPATGLVVIVGRSLQTIERNCLDVLADPVLFGDVAAEVHHTRGATTSTILGRVVHLVGASDARAEGRLRGMTAALAYCDEVTLLPPEFFRQLLARLSVPGAMLVGTTNPDSPKHWLKADYLDRAHELDLAQFHFQLADNPSLSEQYVAALAAEFTGLWRRRMILGEWVVAEGAIYDAYDEQQHVVDDLPPMRRYWLGVDYGTANLSPAQPITERPRPVVRDRIGAQIPNPVQEGEDPCVRLSATRTRPTESRRYRPGRLSRPRGWRCRARQSSARRSTRRSRASSWAPTTGASSNGLPVGMPRPSRRSRHW